MQVKTCDFVTGLRCRAIVSRGSTKNKKPRDTIAR